MELDKGEREELRGLFNAVWSAVPEGPAYDRRKWRRLSELIYKAARDPAPAVAKDEGSGRGKG